MDDLDPAIIDQEISRVIGEGFSIEPTPPDVLLETHIRDMRRSAAIRDAVAGVLPPLGR